MGAGGPMAMEPSVAWLPDPKERNPMTLYMKRGAVAFGLAGAMTLAAAAPSFAAPVLSNTAAVKAAVPNQTTDVAWRGRGLAAACAGFAAGAVIGAAAAGAAGAGYFGRPRGAL